MNSEEVRIDSFLRLGYFIDYSKERAPIDFSRIDKARYADLSRSELIDVGVDAIHKTFAELWQSNRNHVVPLSGGLDSRLILGALLDHSEARELFTFTYGIPGSYDYEIGNAIAQEIGTRHTAIPLNKQSYLVEDEIEAAVRTDLQGVLFHHPPLSQLDSLFPGSLFWSGYVGDAVAGSHLHEPPSSTLEEAKRIHLKNRTIVRSTRLHRCSDADLLERMDGGRLDPDLLTWDEQVLFDEACAKFTAPLVLFRGFAFVTPLVNSPWMDFMFSVPTKYRLGQKLMIDIGRAAFPKLFDLPSKNRLGHRFDTPDVVVKATFWLNRVRKLTHQFLPSVNYPSIQYSDFNEGIRSNPNLRRIVWDSIEDLRRRGICDWVDIDRIWQRHDRRIRNHGDALIVLASLELIFKAREAETAA